jgi:hypothetical protein
VDWLRRTRRPPPGPEPASTTGAAAAGPRATPPPAGAVVPGVPGAPPAPSHVTEGAAPGIAALLDGIPDDGSRAVLDLGPATASSFDVYSRYARRIRFADVMGDGGWPGNADPREGLLRTLAAPPERPQDLILAWDVLDRLYPEDRPRLVEWLAAAAARGARLHAVARGSESSLTGAVRFSLAGTDRLRFEPVPGGNPPRGRILPAEVAKLLSPFRVIHAYTLKSGLREYVALR